MRKCISLLSGCILLSGSVALSQSPSEEFNQFRAQILSDFFSFKSRILDHYDDFLNGEWHEFEAILEEETPYVEPKPQELPTIIPQETPEVLPLAKLPAPKFDENSLPGLNAPLPAGELSEGSDEVRRSGFHNLKIDISNLKGLSGPKVNGGIDGQLAMGNPDLTKPDQDRIKLNVPDFGGPAIGNNASNPNPLAFIDKNFDSPNNYVKSLLHLPDPEFAFGELPGQIAAPKPGESGLVVIDMSDRSLEDYKNRLLAENFYADESTFRNPENEDVFRFDYYGMEAFLPKVGIFRKYPTNYLSV